MVDPQLDLGTDFHVGQLDEHVESVGDPPIRRVFQRNDAELDVPSIELFEHGGD